MEFLTDWIQQLIVVIFFAIVVSLLAENWSMEEKDITLTYIDG